MKCPLPIIVLDVDSFPPAEKYRECLQGECAWWDSTYERCDPTGLSHTLERLTDVLSEVERRMPHEEQFRK